MSPLLNYTTTVDAAKTVAQIQLILAKHGARAVLINYSDTGDIEALSFKVQTPHGEVGIQLPVNTESILKVLEKQNLPPRYVNRPQAIRIAWRIVKDWVEAQMAILETEMVKMEQIFLPYILSEEGRTLYEVMVDSKFQLPEGRVSD